MAHVDDSMIHRSLSRSFSSAPPSLDPYGSSWAPPPPPGFNCLPPSVAAGASKLLGPVSVCPGHCQQPPSSPRLLAMDYAAAAADPSAGGGGADKSFRLLSVSWNQDNSCFAAATAADFRVYTCAPFRETLRRVLPSGGGYAIVEMLLSSSIFALVAAGEAGRHRIELWDDLSNTHLSRDVAGLCSAVRAVRVSRELVAVVLDRTVRVYPLCEPARAILRIPTALNTRGLCCLSCHVGAPVLACPGTARGEVRVDRLEIENNQAATRFIAAHSSDLACMAMTIDGAVLATASVKGTLVRVFSTMDGTCLQEVRRGCDAADIYSIALSPDLKWLAVCSDKGTLHVFSLRVRDEGKHAGSKQAARSVVQTNTASNARSSLSFVKVIMPGYFSSEWSLAQFRLPESTRYVAAFGEQNTVMIIGMDGSFYRCSFDPVNGKEMVQKEHIQFLKDKDSPPIRVL